MGQPSMGLAIPQHPQKPHSAYWDGPPAEAASRERLPLEAQAGAGHLAVAAVSAASTIVAMAATP
jgi:hypothetical protein